MASGLKKWSFRVWCERVNTTKLGMILRSPAEDENGGILLPMVLSSTRHSRARGNPGLLRRISLDTRFRGYDGTQAGLFVLLPKGVFSKEDTKSTKFKNKISETFVSFVIFVVKENKGIVPGYPHKSLTLHRTGKIP